MQQSAPQPVVTPQVATPQVQPQPVVNPNPAATGNVGVQNQ